MSYRVKKTIPLRIALNVIRNEIAIHHGEEHERTPGMCRAAILLVNHCHFPYKIDDETAQRVDDYVRGRSKVFPLLNCE